MQKKNKVDYLVYSFATAAFGFLCLIIWTANNEVIALKVKERSIRDHVVEIKKDVKEIRNDIKLMRSR